MKNPERRHSLYRLKKHWLNGLDSPHPYNICLKKAEILCLMGQRQRAQDIYRSNLEMAEKCGAQPELAESKNELGWTYYALGDTEAGLKYYREAQQLYQALNDRQGQATSLVRIGSYHYYHGDHQQALDCYTQALDLTEEQTDQIARANIFNNIGNIYGEQNQCQSSREYYQKGLEIYRQAGDLQKQAIVLGNIGVVYWAEGKYPQAVEFYLQQLELSRAVGDKSFYSAALGNLAGLYLMQGDYPVAQKYLQERLLTVQELGDKRGLASTFNYLGNLHKAQKNHDLAWKYLTLAVELGRDQNIKFYLSAYLYDLAELNFQTGLTDDSRRLAGEADQYARQMDDQEIMYKCQKLLIKLDWAGDAGQQSLRLEAMLDQPLTDEQKAGLFYDLYKITENNSCRIKAMELYQALFLKTPVLEYREKAEELQQKIK